MAKKLVAFLLIPLSLVCVSFKTAVGDQPSSRNNEVSWRWNSGDVEWEELIAQAGPRLIRFTLPHSGRVSLGIYDRNGTLLRVLLHGREMDTGTHEVKWDGLDWQGNAQSLGKYSWRLVHSPGLTSRFLFRIGTAVPDEPWQRWVGDHVPVATMAGDETGVTFVSYFTEVPDMIVKFDPTLKKRIASSRQWYDGNELQSVGIANDILFGLTRAGKIRRLNRDTLKRAGTWDYIPTPGGQFTSPNDLAARGNTLVATDVEEQQVHFIDPTNGKRLKSVAVASPRKLAVAADGSVLVTSGERAVFVIRANGRAESLIKGLADPHAIGVHPKTGDVFVWDGGDSNQIKRFNKDGQLLKTFGRKGGRLATPYISTNFEAVNDLLIDSEGHLLVAEMGVVRRVARVNVATGKVLSEWFGGNAYYNYAVINPDDPTDVWFEPFVNGLIRLRADYDKRSWKVQSAYRPSPPLPGRGTAGFPYLRWFPRVHDGRTYLLSSNHWLYVVDEERKVLRAIRTVQKAGDKLVVWTDLNEDQQRTDDEVITYAANRFRRVSWMDQNWNLWLQAKGEPTAFYTLKFGGWSSKNANIPTWDYAQIQPGPQLPKVLRQNPDYGSIYVDAKGTVHQTRGAMRMPGDERHGHFWPAIELSVARYMQWTPSQNPSLKSITGKHQTHWGQSKQNVFTQPGIIIGEAKGVISAADRAGQPTGVTFDRDSGLYVGNLLDNRADDDLPDWVYNPWKRVDFGGGQLFELKNGRVIWLMQDWNNHAVMEVCGLDKIRRVHGKVHLDRVPAQAAGKGTGLTGMYYRQQSFKEKAFTHVDPFFRIGPRNTNDQGHESKVWLKRLVDAEVPPEACSVVWTGLIEAPVTEEYEFSIYLTGAAKLFLAGELLIDTAKSGKSLFKGLQSNLSGNPVYAISKPVRLNAGTTVPIRIEWNSAGKVKERFLGYDGPMFHLHWESPVHDRLAIPTKYMYPK